VRSILLYEKGSVGSVGQVSISWSDVGLVVALF